MLLLAALGARFAGEVSALPVTWRQAVADPASLDGAELVFTLHMVSAVAPETTLFRVEAPVPLVGAPDDLAVGDAVSVRGHFDAASGRVVVEELERHPWRHAKGALSLLALVLWLLSVPFWLRPGRGGLSLARWEDGGG